MYEEEQDGVQAATSEDVDEGSEPSIREMEEKAKRKKKKKTKKDKTDVDGKNGEEKRHVYTTFIVDLRRTKMHKDEFGIRLDEQRRAKSRQWTKDMDTIGHVKRDGDDWGKLAIREKVWKTSDPLKKILVMKLFTASFNWRGTIELLQGDSILQSFITKESCPVYLNNVAGALNLTRLRRLPHRPRFRGEVFGFAITDDSATHKSFMIDDKRFTLGSDWYVKDIHKNIVAIINGKFMNVGGRFDIEIYDEKLAKNKEFYTNLVLFASTLRYYKEVRKTIRTALKMLSHQDIDLVLRESEADLYLNPRKLNY